MLSWKCLYKAVLSELFHKCAGKYSQAQWLRLLPPPPLFTWTSLHHSSLPHVPIFSLSQLSGKIHWDILLHGIQSHDARRSFKIPEYINLVYHKEKLYRANIWRHQSLGCDPIKWSYRAVSTISTITFVSSPSQASFSYTNSLYLHRKSIFCS